jgi:hypothetical protein
MRVFLILLALATGLAACEKDAGTSAPGSVESSDEAEEADESSDRDWSTDGFSVGKLKIVAASSVYSNPEAVKPDALEEQIEAALEKTQAHDDDAAPIYGSITYDARTSTTVDGEKTRDIVLFGELRRKGDSDPTTKYSAEILIRSEPGSDKTFETITADAVQQFAERIDAAVRIRGAKKDDLVAILESSKESNRAKTAAIQQIRERQIAGTEPILRDMLAAKNGEPDELRVASAAALVRLGDDASRADILELAQTYSRDQNANMLPMIYILGDMGGEEVVTYLTTVSEAHSSPAVRQVAKEALKEAIETTAKGLPSKRRAAEKEAAE